MGILFLMFLLLVVGLAMVAEIVKRVRRRPKREPPDDDMSFDDSFGQKPDLHPDAKAPPKPYGGKEPKNKVIVRQDGAKPDDPTVTISRPGEKTPGSSGDSS